MKSIRGFSCAFVAIAPASAQAVTVDLTAAPGTVAVAPGVNVNAWLYDGQLPGPTLRVTEGQTLRVRFHNQLPEMTTVHWHGVAVDLGMDGVPGISRLAVAPGQEFLYELRHLVPGTYWFHPHAHGGQLDYGLAGLLIVDPANPANDPAFDVEQTIVLDDWSNPLGGGFTGYLINGRTSAGQVPIAVQPGQRLRLRVLNASATTNYVFALDGHAMTVTHADGNRVQPVVVAAIPIGGGERYDVIVDCNNPGTWRPRGVVDRQPQPDAGARGAAVRGADAAAAVPDLRATEPRDRRAAVVLAARRLLPGDSDHGDAHAHVSGGARHGPGTERHGVHDQRRGVAQRDTVPGRGRR